MDILCSECEGKVDIMSIRKIGSDYVKVIFICPSCGEGKVERHYLYEN